jgi:two-component system chemotaxis response regulator CheB
MNGGPPPSPPPIVALVCSAGGLHPLEQILQDLPRSFPASVIVLQHQSPGATALLGRILGRHCELPLAEVQDGELLRVGTVVVVRSGHHALVTADGRIMLVPSDGSMRYRPSADLLLITLALAAGPRVIAVILSGAGNDGALGAMVVHRCGGTVLASDVASSAYFAMPSAAISENGVVDRVLPIHDIAAQLSALVEGRYGAGVAFEPVAPA